MPREDAPEGRPAHEGLRGVRAAVRVAQEVGALLGRGEVLFGEVQGHAGEGIHRGCTAPGEEARVMRSVTYRLPGARPMNARILVADDDEDLLEMMRRALRREGFTVDTAPNGRRAMDVLRSTPDVDVLVSDIRMPDKDGFELLREARELRPGVRIVMVTAFGADDVEARVKALGADDYLSKPFKVPDLLDVLERVLAPRPGAPPPAEP
jgi:CheY-like chemotaxis protein